MVATYSILGDLMENAGGEKVGAPLVGPNGDAHIFEPAPSDNAEPAEAEMVFESGLAPSPVRCPSIIRGRLPSKARRATRG